MPQGSILSLIFFLLYINDLPECVKHSSIFLYADDTKDLKPISCRLDCLLLQQDLDAIAAKCATWLLILNIAKCFYIRFGLANKPLFNYTLCGIALSQVSTANDLGILFDSKLDFSSNCHKVAAKGFILVNMVLKCFYSKDCSPQCKLFSIIVRPILEFNSSIWSPHLAQDIIAIERVQKYLQKTWRAWATKHIKNA